MTNPLISVSSVMSSWVSKLKLLAMAAKGLLGDEIGVELFPKKLSVPDGFGKMIVEPMVI